MLRVADIFSRLYHPLRSLVGTPAKVCSLTPRMLDDPSLELSRITLLLSKERGGYTYLSAYCQDRRASRTFRLDRMEVADTIPEASEARFAFGVLLFPFRVSCPFYYTRPKRG